MVWGRFPGLDHTQPKIILWRQFGVQLCIYHQIGQKKERKKKLWTNSDVWCAPCLCTSLHLALGKLLVHFASQYLPSDYEAQTEDFSDDGQSL